MKFLRFLARQPKGVIMAIALFMVSVIAVIDYCIIVDISLSIFYLIPIILVTWLIGWRTGTLLSVLCAILWFMGDIIAGKYTYILIGEATSKKYLYILIGESAATEYTHLPNWMPFWNAIVRLGVFLTVSYLLGQLNKAYKREKYFARTDGLTGMTNRRFFLQLLEWEIQRFRRHQRPFTLVYLDVDNFKTVNDRFGHSIGDKLLCLISHTLTESLRQVDTVARLGGDEFAIILPETPYEAAETVLKRLQQQLLEAVSLDAYPVSFSVGAVTFLDLPESPDKMIEQVDFLMYEVKEQGKNGIKHELFFLADPPHQLIGNGV